MSGTELFLAITKLIAVVAGVALLVSIWWRSRERPVRPPRDMPISGPEPFEGWGPINSGVASVGQIGPALCDLNARLSDMEEYLSELRKGPSA